MIRVDRCYTKDEVMGLMEPLVVEWFNGRFAGLTDPQSRAIPIIHDRGNVLVSSPTGSGKTLTAFLSIINELARYDREGKLEDRIYCVYVSPLKALANDVNRNLNQPLLEMRELADRLGVEFPNIRVAVRSGDTSQYERQKMLRKPPHIFITTPESLALVLAAPKFRQRLEEVEWVILDEIHDICDSKRGVLLSLTLERLQAYCRSKITRIGLSATMAPMEAIAHYLVGYQDGQPRNVSLVEVPGQKDLDLSVICPIEDMTALSYDIVNAKMYDLLKEMVDQHETTLVFTNTRSGTESVVYKLKERGLESIEAHHSSLSKETRLDVEERLKRGEIRCVVSSTSLELGIDIGSVDLVCQIGSPKSVAKGLQRIGRSGHGLGRTSKGRLIVFEQDDLVECAVMCRAAHRNDIDRVSIPEDSLDVLAQTLVGMSLEQRWEVDEAFELVRRSYCYRNLSRESFISVLEYLCSRDAFEGVYAKLWYDEEEGRFGKKKGSRMIYFLNLGTIPEEANYKVYTQRGGMVGDLSEKFVERLSPRDIFVLGGRSYEFVRAKGMRAFVKEALGKKPTVPSWTGEMLPRSFDLSMDVARFRREMADRLDEDPKAVLDWLQRDFDIDEGSARSILSYFGEQRTVAGLIPDDRRLLVERYMDKSSNSNLIFHFPFGRRVNDALSRAYAFKLSNQHSCNASVSINDDSFMITLPRMVEMEGIGHLLAPEELESILRRAVKDSELFKQRFRHTASRSFMVLRNYKGRSVSVNRQQMRSHYLLETLSGMESMPVIEETYREIMGEVMDVENARLVLETIASGETEVATIDAGSTPSPFAHNTILAGISDIVLMEDRSALLRNLHRKVLVKAMGADIREFEFEEAEVAAYFRDKVGRVSSKEDIVPLLRHSGPLRVFRERGRSAYPYCDVPREQVDTWAEELLEEGAISTVYLDDVFVVVTEDLPEYAAALAKVREYGVNDSRVLEALERESTVNGISRELEVSPDRVLRSLRKLESMFLVGRDTHRGGRWDYVRYRLPKRDHQDSLDRVVRRHLGSVGPSTVVEVAFALTLPEEDVRRTCDDLVREGELWDGRFLVSEHQQYILRRDHLRLRSRSNTVFDDRTVEEYRRWKGSRSFDSIEGCLRHFGQVGSAMDVFNRVPDFSLDEWQDMRATGRVLWGRLHRGKVRYVLDEDAPLCIAAYREAVPSREEEALLERMEGMGGASVRQLTAATGLPKEQVKETIDRLDRNCHVVRRYQEGEDWSTENVYIPLRTRAFEGDAVSTIIERFLRAYGPVPLFAVRAYTGLDIEVLRSALDRLDVETINVGDAQVTMYLLSDELPDLEQGRSASDGVGVYTLQDPLVQPLWAQVASQYGDRWIHPLLESGRLVGAAELWAMSGCMEARSLDLAGITLDQALDALDGAMGYYEMQGYDILRLRYVNDVSAEDLDIEAQEALAAHGYHLVNGFWAKGRFLPITYTRAELLMLTLYHQHIPRRCRFRTVVEAVASRGYLRSDQEATLRCRNREPLKTVMEKGHLIKLHGIPDYVMYTTREQARLFRAAKNMELDHDMSVMVSILRDRQPLSRSRLYDLSTMGHKSTQEALKGLRRATVVYADASGQLRLVPLPITDADTARMDVVRQLFDDFGVFSAEELSRFLKRQFPMRDLRYTLRELEAEGHLVKGFLMEGDDRPFWMLAQGPKPDQLRFRESFVLMPADNLYLYLQPEIKERFETPCSVVFRGTEMIGSLQAKLKGNDMTVRSIQGGIEANRALREFARHAGLLLREEDADEEEWDIIEFYEKTHPGR